MSIHGVLSQEGLFLLLRPLALGDWRPTGVTGWLQGRKDQFREHIYGSVWKLLASQIGSLSSVLVAVEGGGGVWGGVGVGGVVVYIAT